jgi:hypothetical protein
MDGLDLFEVVLKRSRERQEKHGDPVCSAPAVTKKNLVAGKIDILNPQAQAFHQAKLRSVHQGGHKPFFASRV